ncbi:DUF4352 domain-containing protein [Blastococcus capsensis]|uniref:DUF4352 domain-containing protein n=1 Tax=Blastococcus capsensis TaxID=1564163 RepID=UPI002542300F|nr:DUF4352 domain-containing protein [Blastococcus capsensis]MDK3256564.1 DUF4352 domain-containing protein [Blastococcus capsensis]
MTQPPYAPPPVPPQGAQQWQGDQSYGGPQGQPYGQMPQGQPFGAPAPQPPAKTPFYKKKWFIVLAVIVAIAIIANMTNGGSGDTGTAASGSSDVAAADAPVAPAEEAAPEEVAPEESNPGIGEAAADGDFSFVVSGVDCSLTRIGNSTFGTDAQGQFCVVEVAVTNVGDSAQSFFGDNAKLFNAQGQEFSADTEAAIYLEDSSSIYEEINPGNTLNSKVVFDVPAGTTPTSVELHDSAFSGGVTVSLQ